MIQIQHLRCLRKKLQEIKKQGKEKEEITGYVNLFFWYLMKLNFRIDSINKDLRIIKIIDSN